MTTDLTNASTEVYGDIKGPVNGEPRDAGNLASLALQPLTNALRWLRKRTEDRLDPFLPIGGLIPVAASVSSSVITVAGHGLSSNDPVRLISVGGSIPSPLVGDTTYFAVTVTTNTFQVAATSGGSAIALTDNGSGTIYVAKRVTAHFWQMVADGVATFAAVVVNGLLVVNNGTTINGALTQSGGANTLGGNLVLGGIFQPQVAEGPVGTVIAATNATTATIDVTSPVWYIDAPNPGGSGGGVLTILLDSVTKVPASNQELTVVILRADTHTATTTVQRAGPTTIAQGSLSDKLTVMRFKYLGSSWRLIGFYGPNGTVTAP